MIIILNGPPGSGKDAIAECLENRGQFLKYEFKATLHDIAIAMSGMFEVDYYNMYDNRDIKETPQDSLFGFSPRGFLIHISEVLCKPHFGSQYFGVRAAKAIKKDLDMLDTDLGEISVVFSDGGFPDEVNQLVEMYGIANVKIVHLYREGASFEGDSRDYILEKHTGIVPCVVRNDRTIYEAAHFIANQFNLPFYTVNPSIG